MTDSSHVEGSEQAGAAQQSGHGQSAIHADEARARASDVAAECVERLVALARASGRRVDLRGNDADALVAEFRHCLRDFATALRSAGSPPETMVIEVKRLATLAARRAGEGRRPWIDQSVKWAIQAYYGD